MPTTEPTAAEGKVPLERTDTLPLQDSVKAKPPVPPLVDDPSKYPQGIKLFTILISIFLVLFIVALDRTIIGTAVPKITNEFHSIDDIGWYASAFLLPGCSFMLVFGKLYQLYPVKFVYITCITIFEIGSAICGSAPTSNALITGRAIAGLGSAGSFAGTVIIIVHTIPLQKRPLFQAAFGAMFGLASILGPLLGGAFTDGASWRWCFYINLPIGGCGILALMFLLHIDDRRPETTKDLTLSQKIRRLDPIGTFIFVGGTVCLLLALQWGGTEFPWRSARVIVCLVLSGVLLIAFVGIQIWKKEEATVPPRIIKQRSVASAVYNSFFIGASMTTAVYYIPVWFQAIRSTTAITSGYRTLALLLPFVFASITGGQITFRTGYYVPQMLLSTIIMSIGAGMLTTWDIDVSRAEWIGYQVLYGFGLGLGMQQPNMAIQTVLSKRDIPTGTSLVFFAAALGGAVAISVGQNIFASRFRSSLRGIEGLGAPVQVVLGAGATGLRNVVDPEVLETVLVAFNSALMKAMYVIVATSCLTIVGSAWMEWRSIKRGEGQAEKEVVKGKKPEGNGNEKA